MITKFRVVQLYQLYDFYRPARQRPATSSSMSSIQFPLMDRLFLRLTLRALELYGCGCDLYVGGCGTNLSRIRTQLKYF